MSVAKSAVRLTFRRNEVRTQETLRPRRPTPRGGRVQAWSEAPANGNERTLSRSLTHLCHSPGLPSGACKAVWTAPERRRDVRTKPNDAQPRKVGPVKSKRPSDNPARESETETMAKTTTQIQQDIADELLFDPSVNDPAVSGEVRIVRAGESFAGTLALQARHARAAPPLSTPSTLLAPRKP